jgi:hypothetical protein
MHFAPGSAQPFASLAIMKAVYGKLFFMGRLVNAEGAKYVINKIHNLA